MNHQYESEVLFRLMERDGFNIPSSVPPYEAEIKAYLINQVKLAYPKLTDYEAEWLLYNYTKHLPADFPISSATNVTEATFENVVPFAYQSAILKGQTLVNLVKTVANNGLINAKYKWIVTLDKDVLKPSTIYTWFIYNDSSADVSLYQQNWFDYSSIKVPANSLYKLASVTKDSANAPTNARVDCLSVLEDMSVEQNLRVMLIEGDYTNQDVSYFEGMQSVKMPVLTTIGKNLFDFNKVETNDRTRSMWDTTINNGVITSIKKSSGGGEFGAYATIKVEPSTTYTLRMEQYKNGKSHGGQIFVYTNSSIWGNALLIGSGNSDIVISTKADTKYITIGINYDNDIAGTVLTTKNILLEKSSTSTQYEPYKSIILTVNEPVELHRIGNMQDTLDLMTGEVSQNFIKFEISDGSYFDENFTPYENTNRWQTTATIKNLLQLKTSGRISSSSFINVNSNEDYEHIRVDGSAPYGNVMLYLSKTKASTYEDLITYIKNNPFTIVAEKAEKSIKTVDLKTVNETGESVHFMPLEGTMHVQSSGEPIQPTFDMSVPVEATTQNLASFIDLEMEE